MLEEIMVSHHTDDHRNDNRNQSKNDKLQPGWLSLYLQTHG
jgi:hypothetical protein